MNPNNIHWGSVPQHVPFLPLGATISGQGSLLGYLLEAVLHRCHQCVMTNTQGWVRTSHRVESHRKEG